MQLTCQLGQILNGLIDLPDILDKGLHISNSQLAGDDLQTTDKGHNQIGQIRNSVQDRHHETGNEAGLEADFLQILGDTAEICSRTFLTPIKLEHIKAGQIFLNKAIHSTQSIRLLLKIGLGFFQDAVGPPVGQGNADDDNQCQLKIEIQHHTHDEDNGQNSIDNLQKRLLQGIGYRLHIAGKTAQHIAELMPVKVRNRNLVNLAAEFIAQIPNHLLHSIGHEIIGIIGSNLIKQGSDKIEQHNPGYIAGVQLRASDTIGHIQQILGQLGNSQAQDKGLQHIHHDADNLEKDSQKKRRLIDF
ncbi:hypothetical protein STRDD11_02054 [Streptococcus sp. DD11]|nr:hypothetical protein STRDD11_02054 [Streptococcus sp. DD11]